MALLQADLLREAAAEDQTLREFGVALQELASLRTPQAQVVQVAVCGAAQAPYSNWWKDFPPRHSSSTLSHSCSTSLCLSWICFLRLFVVIAGCGLCTQVVCRLLAQLAAEPIAEPASVEGLKHAIHESSPGAGTGGSGGVPSGDGAGLPDGDVSDAHGRLQRAMELACELLFLSNSRPVHRPLLSGLRRLSHRVWQAIADALSSQVQLDAVLLIFAVVDTGRGDGSAKHDCRRA